MEIVLAKGCNADLSMLTEVDKVISLVHKKTERNL